MLYFAFLWNRDYQNFTYDDARALLRAAVRDLSGTALKREIDTGTARVIAAPHRTIGGDKRLHMTVHCALQRRTYHVYISKNGNFSGLDHEPQNSNKTPGHVNNDWNAPEIENSSEL